MWRGCYDIHWAICHGALIIEVTRDGVNYISQPFGGIDEDLPKILATLREYFQGSSFQMIAILEEGKARLEKFLPEITEYQDDRDNWDYVYLQEKLASLSGRKYHGKKNHANAFRKDYPDYVYEQITEDNFCKLFSEKNYLQNNIVFDKQNNIIAFQLVEHDNTFSYWELIKDER